LKSNCLCTKEAGKALAEMLAANTVLTELDLSDNSGPGARDGPGFAQELAVGIRDNGVLLKFIFGGDRYYDGGWKTPEPATLEVGMAEANFSNKNLAVGGAIIISAWLAHKDNRALLSLNLSSNYIGAYYDVQQGKMIATPEGTLFPTHIHAIVLLTV
jgi:hypothetical protein